QREHARLDELESSVIDPFGIDGERRERGEIVCCRAMEYVRGLAPLIDRDGDGSGGSIHYRTDEVCRDAQLGCDFEGAAAAIVVADRADQRHIVAEARKLDREIKCRAAQEFPAIDQVP